jgi:CheY-like chemotaxis protein
MMAELLRYAGYQILLDLMMPVMSGPELVEALSGDPKLSTLPIVVVSAAIETISTGAVKRALKKPVSLDLLLQVVDECCVHDGQPELG